MLFRFSTPSRVRRSTARPLTILLAALAVLALSASTTLGEATAEADEPTAYSAGVAALRAGDAEDAERHLRRAVDEHPEWYGVHLALGQALATLGRADDALASLARADALSDLPETTIQHARAALAFGRLERAAETLAALDGVELPAAARLERDRLAGQIAFKAERYDDSVAAWRRALEAAPDDSTLARDLGRALTHLDRWADAEDAFERAVALAPRDLLALRELVRVRGELLGEATGDERVSACKRAADAGRRLLATSAAAAEPASATTRGTVARFAACADEPDVAQDLLAELDDAPPSLRRQVTNDVAYAYARADRWKDLLTIARAARSHDESPDRRLVRLEALAHEALEQWDRAHTLYADAGFTDDAARVEQNQRREAIAREESEIAELLAQLEEERSQL